MNKRLVLSEVDTVGTPDVLCDYIRDSVLTEIIKQDPMNFELPVLFQCTTGETGFRFTGKLVDRLKDIDIYDIVMKAVNKVGYGNMYHPGDTEIEIAEMENLDLQQNLCGLYTGSAVAETDDFTDLADTISRAIAIRLQHEVEAIKDEDDSMLRPEAKVKISMMYDEEDNPLSLDTVSVSIAHSETVTQELVKEFIVEEIVEPIVEDYGYMMKDIRKVYINQKGAYTQYGPMVRYGSSGKYRIDSNGESLTRKAGFYMARYIAKNIVASGMAMKCNVTLNYIEGYNRPQFVFVDTCGTGKCDDNLFARAVRDVFKLNTNDILTELSIFSRYCDHTVSHLFGNFGEWAPSRHSWERVDKAHLIKEHCLNSMKDIKDVDIWKK